MGFNISLYVNDSEPNKLDKDISLITTLTGNLLDESSILDPTILVDINLISLTRCNYFYISEFDRYYFITDIVSIRNGIVQISGHVDVLTSFKDEIRLNSAIIQKSENNWNLYLNDGSIHIYQYTKTTTHNFPNGFPKGVDLVLAVAGKSNIT